MAQANKRRRLVSPVTLMGALAIITVAGALLSVPVRATIEVPPNNEIFFQTSGEQAPLMKGDYYSSVDGDNIHHLVGLNIPCLPNQIYAIELFDPEMYDAGDPGTDEIVDDEVDGSGDITNFIFRGPSGVIIGDPVTTFGPYPQPPAAAPPEHDNWVPFHTMVLPPNPVKGDTCGNYTIEVWTGDESGSAIVNNDENAWKHRVIGSPDASGNETFDPDIGPDGRAGTGDEVWLDIQLLSYQHNTVAAQSFFWFVDDMEETTWIGRNFDIDIDNELCFNVPCTITYIAPSGANFAATLSGDTVWNPGQPDRGPGDRFTNSEPGLWQVDIVMPVKNQYIIEIENSGKPIFLEEPKLPEVIIAKDDGVTLVESPGVTTYTLVITNIGVGGALPLTGPEIVDTLPVGMTFADCSIALPLEGTCEESTPGSGLVNFELQSQRTALNSDGTLFGPVLAYLPGVSSGLVNTGALQVTANIEPGLSNDALLTNTVQVDWTDIYDNNYVPRMSNDTDIVKVLSPPPTPTVTLTATPENGDTPEPTRPPSTPRPTPPPATPQPTPSLPTQLVPPALTPPAVSFLTPSATSTVFPASILPETGLKEAKSRETGNGMLSLLTLLITSATIFYVWQLLRKLT